MKTIKLLLAVAFASVAMSSQAQVDYNDPRWASYGETAEEREANMLTNSFLTEAVNNKDYNAAAGYLKEMLDKAPKANDAIYVRGSLIYRNKINRARSLAEKNVYIDSLMIVHDLRLENFGDHPTRGAAYILDSKARMYATYKMKDRAGLRAAFRAAIDAAGDAAKPDLVALYFQNLCDDYKMDEVMADEVLAEYEKLAPFFDGLTGTDVEFKNSFDSSFGISGVASCENLETLFSAKIAADPENEDLIAQAVALMDRAQCDSPFYLATAEKLYSIKPSVDSAMALAAAFQNKGEYDKATLYLTEALDGEEDAEQREKLYSRISLIKLAANDRAAALQAANEALRTDDGTLSDNGVALFVKAQCYARSVDGCGEFDCLAVYWAAYDVMAQAIANFSAEEEAYKQPAQAMLSAYRGAFPTKEECFFNEVAAGSSYRVSRGAAAGVNTTVRYR